MKKLIFVCLVVVLLFNFIPRLNAYFLESPARSGVIGSSLMYPVKAIEHGDFIYVLSSSSVFYYSTYYRITKADKATLSLVKCVDIRGCTTYPAIKLDSMCIYNDNIILAGSEILNISEGDFEIEAVKVVVPLSLNYSSRVHSNIHLPYVSVCSRTDIDPSCGVIVFACYDFDSECVRLYKFNMSMIYDWTANYCTPNQNYMIGDVCIDKENHFIYLAVTECPYGAYCGTYLNKFNYNGDRLSYIHSMEYHDPSMWYFPVILDAQNNKLVKVVEATSPSNPNHKTLYISTYNANFNRLAYYNISRYNMQEKSTDIKIFEDDIYVMSVVWHCVDDKARLELRGFKIDKQQYLGNYYQPWRMSPSGPLGGCLALYLREDAVIDSELIDQQRICMFEGYNCNPVSCKTHDYWIPRTITKGLGIRSGWSMRCLPVESYSVSPTDFPDTIWYDENTNRILDDEYLEPFKGYWVYCTKPLDPFNPETCHCNITGKEILNKTDYPPHMSGTWSLDGYGTYPGWVVDNNGPLIYMNGCNIEYGCYYSLHGGLTVPRDGYWSYVPIGHTYSFFVDQTEN